MADGNASAFILSLSASSRINFSNIFVLDLWFFSQILFSKLSNSESILKLIGLFFILKILRKYNFNISSNAKCIII